MHDPDGVEHGGDMRGLGLLDTKTIFKEAKTRTRIHGHISEEHNIYNLDNLSVEVMRFIWEQQKILGKQFQ